MKKITLTTGKTIEMREPKVRDLRAVSHIDDDAQREFTLLCNLTGVTEDEMDDLNIIDYGKLQEAYAGFLSQE